MQVDMVALQAATTTVQYPSASRIADAHGEMTLTHALSKVTKLPKDVTALVQHKTSHKSSPTGDVSGALDRAKETLNNMMEETEAELDEAILECTEYDRHTVAILDENTRLRAGLGEEVAQARADIADAETVINEARVELDELRGALESH